MKRRLQLVLVLSLVAASTGYIGVRKALRLPILPDFLRPARPLPKGQCTWYAWGRAAEAGWRIRFDTDSGRHARLWWTKVKNARHAQKPAPGAILVFGAWPGNEYGHVAYVESVENDKIFTITHANFAIGKAVAVRKGVTIYEARAALSAKGVALEENPPLPLVGFLVPDGT